MGKIQIFSNIRYSNQLEKFVIDFLIKSKKYSNGIAVFRGFSLRSS